MTLLDAMMSEYGWKLEYALWQVPLSAAFALFAAIDARFGNDPKGPTYVEQEMLRAYEAVAS